jgi:hypothetical protein
MQTRRFRRVLRSRVLGFAASRIGAERAADSAHPASLHHDQAEGNRVSHVKDRGLPSTSFRLTQGIGALVRLRTILPLTTLSRPYKNGR